MLISLFVFNVVAGVSCIEFVDVDVVSVVSRINNGAADAVCGVSNVNGVVNNDENCVVNVGIVSLLIECATNDSEHMVVNVHRVKFGVNSRNFGITHVKIDVAFQAVCTRSGKFAVNFVVFTVINPLKSAGCHLNHINNYLLFKHHLVFCAF